MGNFPHLHIHSHYSLMSGVNTVEEVILAAAEMGMQSIALTDTNGMYGIVPFRGSENHFFYCVYA